jgi:tetratricopeptide (TPR) repeat protein
VSSFNRFLQELRRRKVFRVLAGYAAGAFLVLQAGDLTLGPLGAPDWVYRTLVVAVILGFPLALLLAWMYDLTAEGVQRADPVTEPAMRPRRRYTTTAIVVLALLAVGGAALFWLRTSEVSNTSIAVMPFTVRGNQQLEYLEEGLVDMLSRNIDGAADLRSVAPEMVFNAVGSEEGQRALDPKRAQTVAEKLGAGLYVLGSVNQVGKNVRIAASVYDAASDNPAKPVHVTDLQGDTTNLLDLIDRLSADLLAGTRKGHGAELARTASLTTASIPALREYIGAEKYLRAAEYDSAVAGFRRAIDIDSTFSVARYRLSVAAVSSGRYGLARQNMVIALRDSARLSERERGLLRSFLLQIDGEPEKAEQGYRTLLEKFPDDMEATYQLAQTLFAYNPPRAKPVEESRPYYDAVLAADPEFRCPI